MEKHIYDYTRKQLEDLGFLANTPENRKDKVVHSLNVAAKWLVDAPINCDDDGEIETITLPAILRITNEVDLTDIEVLETCKELRHTWLHADMTRYINLDDPEALFIKSFCEMKINQYKNK
jgi:hypothetical protein